MSIYVAALRLDIFILSSQRMRIPLPSDLIPLTLTLNQLFWRPVSTCLGNEGPPRKRSPSRRSSRIKQRQVGKLPAGLEKHDVTKDKSKPGSVWAVLDGDTDRAVRLSSPKRASGGRGWTTQGDAIKLMTRAGITSANRLAQVTFFF